jgi:imidazolonepropionase-like amidohydrolase
MAIPGDLDRRAPARKRSPAHAVRRMLAETLGIPTGVRAGQEGGNPAHGTACQQTSQRASEARRSAQTNDEARMSDCRTTDTGNVMKAQFCSTAVASLLIGVSASAQSTVTAFERFHVVPMTADTILRDHTVLVADGKIITVGPSRTIKAPRGATRVEGRGRQYLLPALADMHTHATHPQDLALYASHGVLTILNLGWSPDTFVAFERLRYSSGERFGPTIFEGRRMNWPYGRTSGIATVKQARDTVRWAKQAGYEFIKVYTFLADSVYDAIMDESRATGIPTIGHQTNGIGFERAFRDGLKMVVHAEELRPTFDGAISNERTDSLARWFTEYGVWLTPTLSTFQAITNAWGNPARLEQYVAEGLAAHMAPASVASWRRNNYHTQPGDVQYRMTSYAQATRRLHAAGVPMLAGTDGPGITGMIPGIAIHDELRILESIGMSRYHALATATSNAGRFIAMHVPQATPFGTVTVGSRADLIIVQRNPLADLTVLRTPSSVVRLGRVFSAAQLDSIRAAK